MKKHIIVFKKQGDKHFTEQTIPYESTSAAVEYVESCVKPWTRVDGSIEIYDADTLDLVECV